MGCSFHILFVVVVVVLFLFSHHLISCLSAVSRSVRERRIPLTQLCVCIPTTTCQAYVKEHNLTMRPISNENHYLEFFFLLLKAYGDPSISFGSILVELCCFPPPPHFNVIWFGLVWGDFVGSFIFPSFFIIYMRSGPFLTGRRRAHSSVCVVSKS